MKELFFNLALFVVLGILISSLSGCGTGVDLQRGSAEAPGPAAGGAEASKKSSDYPPIAAAIAQSDIKNIDGTTFKLADRKGKVILLNLWATWCGPCRSEMPTLVKMQDQLGGQGLEIIGLNADDEPIETIKPFAQSLNINYQLAWPDTNLQKELLKISQFGGIPQSFLIDRDGRLRGVFRGANPADVRKMEEIVRKVISGEESPMPAPISTDRSAAPPAGVPASNSNLQ